MKKPLDRITEAYFDQMGTVFGNKVRKRIHWICENALGEKVLDVGCSQGITSILLGRESKQVLGIDLLEESINYANEMLDNEANVTKKYVEFKNANFIDYQFNDQSFDSIIFGEILEHVTDPQRFIRRAADLLNNQGQIIITVPFGINDYFDHKKTYYLREVLEFKIDGLKIKKIKFFGKWIGLILVKDNNDNVNEITLNLNLLNELEKSFYGIERSLTNELKSKKEQLKELNNNFNKEINEKSKVNQQQYLELESLNSNIARMEKELKDLELIKDGLEKTSHKEQKQLKDELQKKEELNNNLSHENENYKQQIKKLKESENYYKNKCIELKKTIENQKANEEHKLLNEKREKVKIEKLLLEAYTKEERLLKTHSNLMKRYDALKNSKLGSLTLNYWKWRRKNFGGKSSGTKINTAKIKNAK